MKIGEVNNNLVREMKYHCPIVSPYEQELSEGEDDLTQDLETSQFDSRLDNSNDENDVDEETM